jgi:lipopolysaccharide transport system permease protein
MNLAVHMRQLWAYRDLLFNLVIRNVKVRYKNSILGILWSLLNPLLMMLVFTFVFKVLAGNSKLPAYPAFILSGLLAWNLFSTSVRGATGSIVNSGHLIKKVFFPREVLPISIILSNLVNYLLALPVYFVLAAILGKMPTFSFILATVNVFYRDTEIVIDVVLLAWFFLTPVFYPMTDVAPNGARIAGLVLDSFDVQRWMRILNPMASVIASFRDVLYWGVQPGLDFFLRTAATATLFLIVGYLIFLHFCPVFGEEI